MRKKDKLKLKKDMKRRNRYHKRQLREAKMFRVTNYMETIDYAIDCFMQDINDSL